MAEIEDIAAALGGTVGSPASISARRHDIAVDYRLTDRGSDSNRESWTEVTAALPEHYRVSLRIQRGRPKPGVPVIDIDLGTPVFDEFFIVEAAPTDVVRHWIDERARQFLMAQPGLIELTAWAGKVQFATFTWITDPAKAVELVDFVGGLASRLRDAYAAADLAVPVTESGAPYRPESGAPAIDVQARREQEFRGLAIAATMRYDAYRRQAHWVFWTIVVVVVFGIALAVMLGT